MIFHSNLGSGGMRQQLQRAAQVGPGRGAAGGIVPHARKCLWCDNSRNTWLTHTLNILLISHADGLAARQEGGAVMKQQRHSRPDCKSGTKSANMPAVCFQPHSYRERKVADLVEGRVVQPASCQPQHGILLGAVMCEVHPRCKGRMQCAAHQPRHHLHAWHVLQSDGNTADGLMTPATATTCMATSNFMPLLTSSEDNAMMSACEHCGQTKQTRSNLQQYIQHASHDPDAMVPVPDLVRYVVESGAGRSSVTPARERSAEHRAA